MPCFELNHIVSYIWSQPLFVRSGGRMWDRMILQSKYLYACYDAHRNKKGVGSLENCRKFVWSPITSWLQSGFIEYGTGCLEEVFFFFEQDSISSLAHDVSVSVQTSEPKHILFFSHGSLAPYFVGDCVAASLYCQQWQHCLLPLRVCLFLACGSSALVNSSTVSVHRVHPLFYSSVNGSKQWIVFSPNPLLIIWFSTYTPSSYFKKNNRFPLLRYEHSY